VPWQECYKMDERLRFVGDYSTARKWRRYAANSMYLAQDWLQDLSTLQDCGLDGLTDRSRRPYRHATSSLADREADVQLKRERPAGAHRRSGRSSDACTVLSRRRPSAPCTRASIAMAWSAVVETALQSAGHRLSRPRLPTICGALTTRASSCSPIGAIATRSHQRLRQPLSTQL